MIGTIISEVKRIKNSAIGAVRRDMRSSKERYIFSLVATLVLVMFGMIFYSTPELLGVFSWLGTVVILGGAAFRNVFFDESDDPCENAKHICFTTAIAYAIIAVGLMVVSYLMALAVLVPFELLGVIS